MKKYLLFFFLNLGINLVNKGQIITTVAGNGGNGFGGDGGTATTAVLSYPSDVAFDLSGNMFISDAANNRIRKVDVSGIISTFAGTSTAGYSGDGGQASLAKLNNPQGLAFDANGNLYIADAGNHCVRKITSSGIISTFAGSGVSGSSGDGGQASLAQLKDPYDIAVDAGGNVFIAGNNPRIRKVNTSGVISTYAGNGTPGFSGDNGPATSAQFMSAYAIAIDGSGNLYIADYSDHRIRKVNSTGTITTYAGTGALNSSGDGGPAIAATFWGLYGLGTDPNGNLYISDKGVHNMRKIDNTGTVTHFVGSTGSTGFSGDGGPANQAQINSPQGIGMDASFNLYFADSQNHRVRKVCLAPSCATGLEDLGIDHEKILVYPNPNSGSFSIKTGTENAKLIIMNSLGQAVYIQYVLSGTNIVRTKLASGLYNYQIVFDSGKIKTGKVSVQ